MSLFLSGAAVANVALSGATVASVALSSLPFSFIRALFA